MINWEAKNWQDTEEKAVDFLHWVNLFSKAAKDIGISTEPNKCNLEDWSEIKLNETKFCIYNKKTKEAVYFRWSEIITRLRKVSLLQGVGWVLISKTYFISINGIQKLAFSHELESKLSQVEQIDSSGDYILILIDTLDSKPKITDK